MGGARIFTEPLQEEKNLEIAAAEKELMKKHKKYTEEDHKRKLANIDSNWINRFKGFNLYQKITFVVTLKDNWRHRINRVWVNILNRWRRGIFTDEDVAYANNTCKVEGIAYLLTKRKLSSCRDVLSHLSYDE
jgi:hypothetical protein